MQFENKIKRFITCHIPVYACNFRCTYCYVGQHPNAYKNGIKEFCMSPDLIVQSLSPERLGGYCYFNLCGLGETMLHPQLIELVAGLTKQGHFVDIITNGVLKNKFTELVSALSEEQKKHLFVKFSFHYCELKTKNLLDTFCSDIELIKTAGISYSVEVTPHDDMIPLIDEIKEFAIKHFGALPHITVARNEATKEIALLSKYSKEAYKNIWGGVFDSVLFDFKLRVFNERRKEFCYAGEWSLSVNLLNGEYKQCYCGRTLGNIQALDKPLNFCAIGKCGLPHCYNAHAFWAWGNIPELEAPTYAAERDRTTLSGGHWLFKECREFFSTKLFENNTQYSQTEKEKLLRKNFFANKILFVRNLPKKVCRKLLGYAKGKVK